jgi:hypothetical protein
MEVGIETRRAVFSTVFLFGLLAWLYVILIQVTHPTYLHEPLTHIDIFPLNVRVDVAGIVAFLLSAISFFFWQLSSQRDRK